jgi:ribosomal protein S18 acetylase RimI-like enzyme
VSDDFRVDPVTDRAWLSSYIRRRWGEPGVVSRGRLRTGTELSALCATDDNGVVGVVSWLSEGASVELVTLDSERPGKGIGTLLMDAILNAIDMHPVERVWLVTTNDNIDALRFYQKRGWRLAALHAGAIAESRRLKPSIPETGAYGIPIRDEIELEYPL